jgi:hypothetical protein
MAWCARQFQTILQVELAIAIIVDAVACLGGSGVNAGHRIVAVVTYVLFASSVAMLIVVRIVALYQTGYDSISFRAQHGTMFGVGVAAGRGAGFADSVTTNLTTIASTAIIALRVTLTSSGSARAATHARLSACMLAVLTSARALRLARLSGNTCGSTVRVRVEGCDALGRIGHAEIPRVGRTAAEGHAEKGAN